MSLARPASNSDDRMPVILAPDDHAAWLGEDEACTIGEPLRLYASAKMRAYRISTAVNNVRNDEPKCIEPAA